MSSGLSLFDADGKLLVWNDRYVELYAFPPGLIRRGVSIYEILAYRKRSDSPTLDAEAYVADFRQSLLDGGEKSSSAKLADGRIISVTKTPTAGGGWVGIHEDITERKSHEEEIFGQATELARTNMRFEAALSNMTQGLCLFDSDKRLVIANERFRDMYDLPHAVVAPGTPLPLILQQHAARGATSELTVDEHVEAIPGRRSRPFTTTDGREIMIKRASTDDGGWGGDSRRHHREAPPGTVAGGEGRRACNDQYSVRSCLGQNDPGDKHV